MGPKYSGSPTMSHLCTSLHAPALERSQDVLTLGQVSNSDSFLLALPVYTAIELSNRTSSRCEVLISSALVLTLNPEPA